MNSTWFEMGGELIELYEEPKLLTSYRKYNTVTEQASYELTGDKKVLNQMLPESITSTTDGFTVGEISTSLGRAKRAQWALTTAATLALVDGPLPIGDAVAAVFLAAYAGYELGLIYKDFTD